MKGVRKLSWLAIASFIMSLIALLLCGCSLL
jgi:hypothetical protein